MFWASDNEERRPFLLPRVFLACAMLGFVGANLGLIVVATKRYPPFFSQPGAHKFVLEPVLALLAYAVAIVVISRTRGLCWDSILRAAILFGGFSGIVELINIGIENSAASISQGPVVSVGFMIITFTLWGIAGFRTARSLGSTPSGLLAAVSSACICMLIAVATGFVVRFLLVPPKPSYVSTWAEFKRSGWTDARAFGVANTLDSGFTHLVVAPIVALVIGGLASFVARFTSKRPAPIAL